jgi:hypothetical protein
VCLFALGISIKIVLLEKLLDTGTREMFVVKLSKNDFDFSFCFLISWCCALMSVWGSGSIFGHVFGILLAMKDSWHYTVGMILMFYTQ